MSKFDKQFGEMGDLFQENRGTIGRVFMLGVLQVLAVIIGVCTLIAGFVTGFGVWFWTAAVCAVFFCVNMVLAAFLIRARAGANLDKITGMFDTKSSFFDDN